MLTATAMARNLLFFPFFFEGAARYKLRIWWQFVFGLSEPAKGSAAQPSWSALSHEKAEETETAGMKISFLDT